MSAVIEVPARSEASAHTPQTAYSPSREEQARQDYVLALKLFANGLAQRRVRDACAERVLPAAAAALGRAARERTDIEVPLARTPEFRTWAVLTHWSQTMMWRAIEATVQRCTPRAQQRLAQARATQSADQPGRRGTLELDPHLHVPPPIANCEIHRQPGGFVGSADPLDLTPGLRYFGAQAIYGVGKGNAGSAGDGRAAVLLSQLAERFPGQRPPQRILELGCGVGTASQAIARAFPAAEYHAVDVAAGVLRLGHVLALERGLPIHFYQRDAAHTGFEAASFDLVLSNIMFHETNSARLPQILRECHRVLRPGGVMLHADVATQIARVPLADQVMNHWQVLWNGEPFWTGFAQADMAREIVAAGFAAETTFADYVQKPGAAGAHYVFGARR
jgi:SAM-dependent methyltransferase